MTTTETTTELDIEALRAWLRGQQGRYRVIAEATAIPYTSLQKFAQGRVAEPRYSRLMALEHYRRTHPEQPDDQAEAPPAA